jgi:hypothetical protein
MLDVQQVLHDERHLGSWLDVLRWLYTSVLEHTIDCEYDNLLLAVFPNSTSYIRGDYKNLA